MFWSLNWPVTSLFQFQNCYWVVTSSFKTVTGKEKKMQNLACMYYAKQSVAKEMEFDNKNDKYYKEKKKKANQTRTKSYRKEITLALFGVVFLI